MYQGFNLKISSGYSDYYYNKGQELFSNNKKQVEKELSKFASGDGYLDGSKMQSNWFPQIEADIFISHSHKDEHMAIGLAGWLYDKFGLKAFIDSCLWGYCDELLKKLDDKYCMNQDKTLYYYSKRNASTSHIHMMLSTALAMMLDKTECIFFLNTPNSIMPSKLIESTESPWIYCEIALTKLIRKAPKRINVQKSVFNPGQGIQIKYGLDMKHLYEINGSDLNRWDTICKSSLKNMQEGEKYDNFHPLDKLYDIVKNMYIKKDIKSIKEI